ncbi:MAG: ankyrin repeat domain-containing protein [Thermotogae bacterium]|nr:ankyrin repeat domain-containing protein [Thermotogota bacterium]
MKRLLLLAVTLLTLPALGAPLKEYYECAVPEYFHTPLHCAAGGGDVEAIKELLKRGERIDARDIYGRTPLHYAAMDGKSEAVRYLLSIGADPNARDNLGKTPLHYAVHAEDVKTVKALVEGGADPEAPDEEGETPLLVADRWGPEEVFYYLMKAAKEKRQGKHRQNGAKGKGKEAD